jgi:outer membrane biosynthesis protein TonB
MMIPRTLVPVGARPPAADATSTRRRPSALDERTLVPATLPIVALDGRSTIPANLPLDSIAARVVVPRDLNVAEVQSPEKSTLPPQPTDLDERITVPQGAAPPTVLPPLPQISEDLVEPDIIQTGEVAFLPPERPSQTTFWDYSTRVTSVAFHILLILLLIFEPKIFRPHVRTNEEEEIARRQITVLLPPGALESLKASPPTAPPPHEAVRVDPKVLKKVAPSPIEPPPAPAPQPEAPKKELPSAPVPQSNPVPPAQQPNLPVPKSDTPKAPVKLETPDTPAPRSGLVLPKQQSPGDTIRDAARGTGRINSPVPTGGGGQLPGSMGGGGGRGSAYGAVQMLTDNEGIDFNDYLHRVYVTVKRNWFAVMPPSVQLGDQGVVSLQFRIMKNGGVPDGEPVPVFGSGKEPLDRAAFSSIRASNPFEPLPSGFKAPYIELRFTYYYNLQPPNVPQQ